MYISCPYNIYILLNLYSNDMYCILKRLNYKPNGNFRGHIYMVYKKNTLQK